MCGVIEVVAVFWIKFGPKVGIRDRSQFLLLAASAGMPSLAPFEAFLQDYAAFWIELFLQGEGKNQTQCMLVVYRYPGVPAQIREFRLGGGTRIQNGRRNWFTRQYN